MVLYGIGGLIYSVFARRWLAALGERGLAVLAELVRSRIEHPVADMAEA